MMQPRPRHWLAVVLAAICVHGAVFAAWYTFKAPLPHEGAAADTQAVRIALAPVPAVQAQPRAQAAPQPATRPQPEPNPEPKPAATEKPQPEPKTEAEPTADTNRPDTPTAVTTPKDKDDKPKEKQSRPKPETKPKPKKPKPAPEPKPKPKSKPKPKPERKPKTTTTTHKTATADAHNKTPEPTPDGPMSEEATTDGSVGATTTQDQPPRSGTIGSVADTPPAYRQALRKWLVEHKNYPRRARRLRQQGTVVLHFVMARDGRILSWAIRKGSGHKLLDDAVRQLIQSDDRLPALPADVHMQRLAITVPIRFRLQ